jgi:hypothetical protein
MLTEVIQTSLGVLDRRFVLSAFLPTVVFAGLAGLTVLPGALNGWQRQSGAMQIMYAVAFLAAALLVASLVANLPLIRFYEGYWGTPVGRGLARLGRAHHRAVLDRLGREGNYQKVERRYPLPSCLDEVQPTTLGNVLRNSEIYARDRYGIDAVVAWPRLFMVVPDHARASIGAVRGDLELLVNVATFAWLYALVAGIHEVVVDGPWWRFLLLFLGPLLVAWFTYLGAVAVAVAYGSQIKSIFDTYRRELLEKISAEDAKGDERDRWYRVTQFWYRGIPLGADLLPDEEPQPQAVDSAPLPRRPRLGVWLALVAVILAGIGVLAG